MQERNSGVVQHFQNVEELNRSSLSSKERPTGPDKTYNLIQQGLKIPKAAGLIK